VQAVVIERDKLKAELNMLKSITTLSIDRRKQASGSATATRCSDVGPNGFELTPSEREALTRALQMSFLQGEGWSEGPNGEIVNERGRRIFEAGFADAIRKVLRA
jgi:hypothetical protein